MCQNEGNYKVRVINFNLILLSYKILEHLKENFPSSIYVDLEIHNAEVPLVLWSLWDSGVENAPPMQKACLASHRAANPAFRVKHLDLKSAVAMTKVLDFIPKR